MDSQTIYKLNQGKKKKPDYELWAILVGLAVVVSIIIRKIWEHGQ
jgi:hypothetical protein